MNRIAVCCVLVCAAFAVYVWLPGAAGCVRAMSALDFLRARAHLVRGGYDRAGCLGHLPEGKVRGGQVHERHERECWGSEGHRALVEVKSYKLLQKMQQKLRQS